MGKGKKNFNIQTPKDCICITTGGNARVEWNHNFGSTYGQRFENAQAYIDKECIRRMEPEMPFRSSTFNNATTAGTVIGSGEINQSIPLARRLYYEHKEKSRWFERMKNRHKDRILEGAIRIASR